MRLSIIIPVLNELENLAVLLPLLRQQFPKAEMIVVDGGSTDGSWAFISQQKDVKALQTLPGRAVQLNAGAAVATGDYYYFLHADSRPPIQLAKHLSAAVATGYEAACCRLRFDHAHWFLQLLGWFTRFSWNGFRFGDQSLFVARHRFKEVGGYDERRRLLEDNDLVVRLRRVISFRVLPVVLLTSARKYVKHGIFRLQLLYIWLYCLDRLGYGQEHLIAVYQGWLGDAPEAESSQHAASTV